MTQASDRARLAAVSVAIALLGCATFGWNLLHSADPSLFRHFQDDSDALVLDALRSGSPMLGLKGADGFHVYLSQYGGQLPLLRALGGLSVWTPAQLGQIVACLTAAMIGLATWLVGRRMVSLRGAAAFGLFAVLSPMSVMIAGSVYWMVWSWFLPLLVSLWLVPRLWTRRGLLLAAVGWWLTLTLKDLFGYEFASSIAVAAAVPIVFAGLRHGRGLVSTALPCLVLGAVSALAMLSAMVLQVHHFGQLHEGQTNWSDIAMVAKKRIDGSSSVATLRTACADTPSIAIRQGAAHTADLDQCVSNLQRTQSAPLPLVVATYLTFHRTIPWLGQPDLIDSATLAPVRNAIRRGHATGALEALRDSGWPLLGLLSLPASMLLVWLGAFVAVWRIQHLPRRERRARATGLAVAALAPLSWVILATPHAYGHMQITFVLWDLPFLPLLAAILVERHAGAAQPPGT